MPPVVCFALCSWRSYNHFLNEEEMEVKSHSWKDMEPEP
jgi:hypothetical protein